MDGFIIIGPVAAITYKEVYPLLKNKILTITEREVSFYVENKHIGAKWFSTLNRVWINMSRRQLTKTYDPEKYPKYDNYDAVECNNKNNIPINYDGNIGVPISFFFYYPELDYEIVDGPLRPKLNGKTKFPRLIIRRKQI